MLSLKSLSTSQNCNNAVRQTLYLENDFTKKCIFYLICLHLSNIILTNANYLGIQNQNAEIFLQFTCEHSSITTRSKCSLSRYLIGPLGSAELRVAKTTSALFRTSLEAASSLCLNSFRKYFTSSRIFCFSP